MSQWHFIDSSGVNSETGDVQSSMREATLP